MFCAAPTVLIGIANAPAELRQGVRRGLRVLTAGAPPAATTIATIEGDLGWDVTQVYGLTETAPFITVCEPRPEHTDLSPADRATIKACQGVELITSGELRVVTGSANLTAGGLTSNVEVSIELRAALHGGLAGRKGERPRYFQ